MLLIFDCDGVLIDSVLLHTDVETEAYEKLGMHITSEELTARFCGYSQQAVLDTLSRETGCPVPDGFAALVDEMKMDVFTKKLKPMPGIFEVLNELKDMPRAIASGTDTDLLIHSLKITKLYDLFAPHIYSSTMVEHGKPAPDIMLLAMERAGLKPNDCLIIEDGAAGVLAARAAGMRAFGFVGGSRSEQDRQGTGLKAAGAELIFSNLHELPSLIGSRMHGPNL